jgi:hypothetical protein
MDQRTVEDFDANAREMILLKEQKSRLEKREAELKKSLMAVIAEYGEEYGGDHLTIRFAQPIRGYTGFVRQTRVSNGIDETAAEWIARSEGIYDRLFKPVMCLDEDALHLAIKEGVLKPEQVDSIIVRKVTHAFVMDKK